MTSRLKRKLNDLGVDPSSSKANESFCLIGTPLPPLEKSKDTGEFVPLWKQEVRDEKGRRRLHGAFTGGFSAGYFNSVGSKEGWAPSTFISSRSDRAKAKAARPEDFMDEEDLAELRESRKLVDENEEMEFGDTEAELRRRTGAEDSEKDPMTAALEASLAPAPTDSIGARILKKMGWRLGQGIGPRLTYAQRKAQDAGFMDPSRETGGADEEDEEAKKHLFPRRDTSVLLAPRKDNSHGVGYVPGMRLEESVSGDAGRSQGPSLAAGFGLGALNDADEDDLDVYDMSTGRQGRSRMAFDIMEEDDGRDITMGPSRQYAGTRPSKVTLASVTQTFNDGRPVLKGFVLSDRPVAEDRWFPLPEIPPGWKPNPRRVWEQEKNKENVQVVQPKPTPTTHAAWKDSFMSADERGAMLGETPLPQKPRSVFDYMSQKDRERLQNIKNAPPPPAKPALASPSPAPAPSRRPGEIYVPELHPSVAKAALHGFQPFTADPVKQSRYTAFLTFQANRTDSSGAPTLSLGPLPPQSIEDFNKELEDYAKAATVFKPLSAAMAGRFRSAAIVESGPTVVEGLYQPTPGSASDSGTKEEQEEEKDDDPRMGAVRLGMYGPLTREVHPWQPARLLCKRFGVKDPEVDMSGEVGGAGSEFMPTAAAMGAGQQGAGGANAATPSATTPVAGTITDGTVSGDAPRRDGPRDLAKVGLGDDEDQGRDTLTYERPAMNIFKAIFASDDEDSDDEDADGNVEDEPTLDIPARAVSSDGGVVKTESVPSHLALSSDPVPSYEPQSNGPVPFSGQAEKVDLASFKPTFVPRAGRETRKDKGKGTGKKDKEKKKKASKATLSFDVEEDGFGPNLGAPISHKEKEKTRDKDGEHKKKKRKESKVEEEDDSMWVEAPPPEVAKSLPVNPPPVAEPLPVVDTAPSSLNGAAEKQAGPLRGRKRAIDFM